MFSKVSVMEWDFLEGFIINCPDIVTVSVFARIIVAHLEAN